MCIKWRFPGNNYSNTTSLEDASISTFMKDPMASLAREICQNSIDAKLDNCDEPVVVEFKSFYLKRENVPGIEDLTKQVSNCMDFWSAKETPTTKLLKEMTKSIQNEEFLCLRISDFNTKGLQNIDKLYDSSWSNLIHGSGVSEKGKTSGGSKGIGKFATFVSSKFRLVFYSTESVNGEKGYEGVCRLCSSKIENSDELTLGVGYYSSSHKNEAVLEKLNLDSNFVREDKRTGTDIFVVGFKDYKNWVKTIVSKVLESFMAAILFNELKVVVDDIILDAEHLADIVHDDSLIVGSLKKNIISQYILLTDKENVHVEEITIDDMGTAKVFVKDLSENDEHKISTNGCVMIRYPYMKIKDLKNITTLPCSAMCIIENNALNEMLRKLENPQHTDWELNREEDEILRSEWKLIIGILTSKIKNVITEYLSKSDGSVTDIKGAENFLSFDNESESKGKDVNEKKLTEKPISGTNVKVKSQDFNANHPNKNGDGVELVIGGETKEEGFDTEVPTGGNSGSGGEHHEGDKPVKGKEGKGDSILTKHVELRGMEYRFFCINKKERKYCITFISDYDKIVTLELFAVDFGGSKTPVIIEKCQINGVDTEFENNSTKEFEIVKGQRTSIVLITNQYDLFSGEVKVYENR